MKKAIILFSILIFVSLSFSQSVVVKNSSDNTLMVVEEDGDVGIGTTAPQGALEINSTTGGLIVPRMSTANRDILPNVPGTIIYNTTTKVFNFNEDGVWVEK